MIIGAILMSAAWKPGVMIPFPGGEIALQNLVRDAILVATALVSLALTAKTVRERNGFNWHPILEVAKLFAGIFLCMIPVLCHVEGGDRGRVRAADRADHLPGRRAQSIRLFLDDGAALRLPRQCADLSGVFRACRRQSAAS